MSQYKVVRENMVNYLKMDTNKDNKISYNEMVNYLFKKDSKTDLTYPLVYTMFKGMDLNNDRTISKDELEKSLTDNYIMALGKRADEYLVTVFKDFDVNKDGKISYDECLNLFKAHNNNNEYYEQWTDWAFGFVNKTKKDQLTNDDLGSIHMAFSIMADNQ